MRHLCVRLLVISALAWTAASCAVNDKIVVRDRGASVVDQAQLVDRYPDLALMNEIALLSAAVYDKPNLPATKAVAEYCDGGEKVAFDPEAHGWKEDLNVPGPPTPPPGVRRVPGLRYRVWVKPFGGRKVAVLAFRGTQSASDWFSNLRWVTMAVPRVWDHYEQLLAVMPALIEAIKTNNGPDTIIIPTGHSLGGGLAQLAGYSSNGAVDAVLAFDPSTVTHFYGVPRELRNVSKTGQKIFRIFEQGEILSYVRWIMKRVYPIAHENPQIVQVKYRRLSGGLVRNHSMRKFACAAFPREQQTATATSSTESPR